MSPKQDASLSELRVGIFVLIALTILAMAIFAIGSQVGLFEKKFFALTYLSNVSGLKPGDVVLLGGVEVGNVSSVEISRSGDPLPETVQNLAVLQRTAELEGTIEKGRDRIATLEKQLATAKASLTAISAQARPDSAAVTRAQRLVTDLEDDLSDALADIKNLEEDKDRVRSRLQNIEVVMQVNEEYRDWIRADSNISLGSIGLLGDKYIEISLGRSEKPPQTVSRTVDQWFSSGKEDFLVVAGTQQASFGELITGANDILANFETLSSQIQDIMRSFEAGEGTIGRLITDPTFYNNLNSTVDNANRTMQAIGEMVTKLSSGPGTVSKLINDDALYTEVTSVSKNLSEILEGIRKGEGTLGKFARDPALYDNANQAVVNVDNAVKRVNEGQGTLGRLSVDDHLYASLADSADRLASILERIESGEGTLGKLSRDDRLYNNISDVSAETLKLMYDFRQNPKKFLTIKFELF